MNALTTLISSPQVSHLNLVLLHFLWQGLAVAVLAGIGLLALRKASPNARYALLLVALGLMVIAPVVTYFVLPGAAQPAVTYSVSSASVPALAPHTIVASTVPTTVAAPKVSLRTWLLARLDWLVAIWVAGVSVLSFRLLLGWLGLGLLRRRAQSVGEEWAARLASLVARMNITRPVALLESARVHAPALVGWLRPAVLLPSAALVGLTPEQLEAIIAHELAHLRRHDYLVNLLQSFVETLLFYHPAVWWLSRRIRQERECCCDDIAAQLCGDAKVYARALTTLRQVCAAGPELAPAANGGEVPGRIRRLLRVPAPRTQRSPWVAGLLALSVVASLLLAVHLSRPAVAAEQKAAAKRMMAQVVEAMGTYAAADAPPVEETQVSKARAKQLSALYQLRLHSIRSIRQLDLDMKAVASRMAKLDERQRQLEKRLPSSKRDRAETRKAKGKLLADRKALKMRMVVLQGARRSTAASLRQIELQQRTLEMRQRVLELERRRASEQGQMAKAAELQTFQQQQAALEARQKLAATVAEREALQKQLKELDQKRQELIDQLNRLNGGPQATGVPAPSVPGEITRMCKLEFLSPQFLLYQLGLSDDPGPNAILRDPSYRELAGMGNPHAGNRGGGDLGTFLPKGVSEVVAYPMLNSVLVRGTQEGVDKFAEFLKLIDKKPQQIFIEIRVYPAVLANGQAEQLSATNTEDMPNFVPLGTKQPVFGGGNVEPSETIRVATMNLMTATNTVGTGGPEGRMVERTTSITPRINGDGTLTLTINGPGTVVRQSPNTAVVTTKCITLNINDGETFALVYPKEKRTMVITPRIIQDEQR